eukprot:9882492-Alexandrium_andersonii.AAC.1
MMMLLLMMVMVMVMAMAMVMVMMVAVVAVVVTGNPKRAQNRSLELLRGPVCAVVRARPKYDEENLPRA